MIVIGLLASPTASLALVANEKTDVAETAAIWTADVRRRCCDFGTQGFTYGIFALATL